MIHYEFDEVNRIPSVRPESSLDEDDFAEHLVSHFASADVKQFPAGELEQARHWMIGDA